MAADELLARIEAAGLIVEVRDYRLIARPASALTDELRDALRAAKPELTDMIKGPPGRWTLTAAEGDAAHAEAWDDAACARFLARVGRFMRLGMREGDAEDLAERLHLRDTQADRIQRCPGAPTACRDLRCSDRR